MEQRITNLELYKKKLEEKGLNRWKLIKLTGIKKSTLYAYFDGKYPLTPRHCAIFADAIGVEVTEVFPQLNTRGPELADVTDGEYDPNNLKERVLQKTDKEIEEMEKDLAIKIEDMVANAATLVPEDGFTLKSRTIVDHNDTEREALSVQTETQVIIKTGVKALNIDLNRTMVYGIKRQMLENECHIVPSPISINGELAIVMYVHGKPLMISRGTEVARLIFF
jgi:lambda repressor-like predicted transcriptional regulator